MSFNPITSLSLRELIKASFTLTCLALLLVRGAYAQENNRNFTFSGDLGIAVLNDDNANFADEDFGEEPQEETQIEYDLGIAAELERDFVAFDLAYDGSRTDFTEDSQDELTRWNGDSNLTFGRSTDIAQADFFHSIREEIRDTSQPDLNDNTNERQSYGGALSLRPIRSARSTLAIVGNYSMNESDRTELNNSTLQGASAVWTQTLSAVSKLSLSYDWSDIEYEVNTLADFESQTASATYDQQLGRSSITIGAGHTQIDPESGDKFSGPFFSLALAFDLGLQSFSISADRQITDSSNLDGEGASRTQINPGDQDQVTVQRGSFSWDSRLLCARCNLSLRLSQSEREYRNLIQNDSSRSSASLNFTYRFSPRFDITSQTEFDKVDFNSESTRTDSEQISSELRFEYGFLENLRSRLFYEWENWDFENGREFSANSVGLGLTYSW